MVRFACLLVPAFLLAAPALAQQQAGEAPAAGLPRDDGPATFQVRPSSGLYEDLTRLIEAEIKANDRQHVGTPNPFMKPRARPSRLPPPPVPAS